MPFVYRLEVGAQVTPLSRDAVDRILESVGTVAPDDIDKDSLARDLDIVHAFFQATEQNRSRKQRLAREKYAKGIRKHAGALLKALDDQDHGYLLEATLPKDNDDGYWQRAARYKAPSIENLRHDLSRLIEAADLILDPPPYNTFVWTPNTTAVKRLVAGLLPGIYREFFGRNPGRSRSTISGEVGGPYVRFVQAVAVEFGTTISPETVDAYLKR